MGAYGSTYENTEKDWVWRGGMRCRGRNSVGAEVGKFLAFGLAGLAGLAVWTETKINGWLGSVLKLRLVEIGWFDLAVKFISQASKAKWENGINSSGAEPAAASQDFFE